MTLWNQGWTAGDNFNTTKYGPLLERYAVANGCWERSRKLDLGLDLTLFRNWNIVFDYFHEKRYNILMMRASWPNMLGFSNAVPYAPVGKMSNWGYELSTTYSQQIGKDLTSVATSLLPGTNTTIRMKSGTNIHGRYKPDVRLARNMVTWQKACSPVMKRLPTTLHKN